jgi:hypothetical protein
VRILPEEFGRYPMVFHEDTARLEHFNGRCKEGNENQTRDDRESTHHGFPVSEPFREVTIE